MTPLILVIGATGTVGTELVKQLADTGARVRALTRDSEKAKKLGSNVEVVQGDLEKPETLAAAFAGVDKAFVATAGAQLSVMEGNAYEAAKRAGVTHLVKLSGRHLDADWMLEKPLARWHRDSEQRLRVTGIPWTIVRPGAFSSNFLTWFDRKQSGVFLPMGQGRDTFIDPRDVAAVVAKALTESGHTGAVYEVTGGEWLDFSQAAAKLSAVIDRPVTYTDIPDAVLRDALMSSGAVHPDYIESFLCYCAAIRDGKVYAPTTAVHNLLGRAPRSFEEWARDNAASLN
jgi:uncharacterized protein YbjT (DUF2867 family)